MFPPSLSSIIESASRHGRQWEFEYGGMRLSATGQEDTDNLVKALPAMEETLGRLARQAAPQTPAIRVESVQTIAASASPSPHEPASTPDPVTVTPATPVVAMSVPKSDVLPASTALPGAPAGISVVPAKIRSGDAPPATDLVSLAQWHLGQYQRRDTVSIQTPSVVDRTLELFIASVGNKDIKALTFMDMDRFMADLAIWPKNAHRIAGYKSKGIAGVLEKARAAAAKRKEDAARKKAGKAVRKTLEPAPKMPPGKKSTQENHVQHLSAFFNHALEWELRPDNPVLSINRRREFGKRFTHPKRSFTNPEWKLPFRAEILDHVTEPHKFFGMLILGYTGARPNEIAQLKRHDVRMESVLGQDGLMHDLLCMHITTSADQHTKNEEAIRLVPVPNQVFAMGFGDYLNDLDRHGATELFPGLQEAEKRPGGSFSKYFNPALRKWGVTDPSVTLYCFRHFLTTLMSKCRVPELVQDALFGHSSSMMTVGQRTRTNHYINTTTPLTILEALDSLPFPQIDAKPYESGRFDQYLSYELARLKHNDEREARGEERIPRKGPVPKRGPFKPKAAKPATPEPKGKTPKAKAAPSGKTSSLRKVGNETPTVQPQSPGKASAVSPKREE
jgi:integrase